MRTEKYQIPSEYMQWFNKKHGSLIKASSVLRTADQYLKFNLNSHLNETQHYGFCINDSDGYIYQIRNNEQTKIFANEGLITTYPTKKLSDVYKHIYKSIVSSSLVEMTFPNSSEKIYDWINLSDPNEKISPLVQFCFPSNTLDESKPIIDTFTKKFELFGYYMSSIDIDKNNDIYLIYIQFEAKYTNMLADLTNVLYHVSPIKNISKIVKRGLIPYSKAKQFKYNPRVYMFNKCDKSLVYQYGTYKAVESEDTGFCIFKVIKDKLINDPLFSTGKQKFYLDPTFSQTENMSTDQTALFTYGNIPLRIIENDFVVVELNEQHLVKSITTEKISEWKK